MEDDGRSEQLVGYMESIFSLAMVQCKVILTHCSTTTRLQEFAITKPPADGNGEPVRQCSP